LQLSIIWMFLFWHPLFHQTSIARTKKFEIDNKSVNLILNSDTLSINQSYIKTTTWFKQRGRKWHNISGCTNQTRNSREKQIKRGQPAWTI